MIQQTKIADIPWEGLAPGLKRHFEVLLTSELLDRFVECSGDCNPIHVSADEARSRGFRGRVAHGMLLGALFSQFVGCHLPGRKSLLLSANLKFHQPCFEGDLVCVEGKIEGLSIATRTVSLSVKFLVSGEQRGNAKALVVVQK